MRFSHRALLSGITIWALLLTLAFAGTNEPIKGKLSKVDAANQEFTVLTEDGASVMFHFNEQTKVSGAESVEGLVGQSGSVVTVHYDVRNDEYWATRIELHQR